MFWYISLSSGAPASANHLCNVGRPPPCDEGGSRGSGGSSAGWRFPGARFVPSEPSKPTEVE